MSTLFIGVMSGTSLDGVDAVLVDFNHGFQVLAHVAMPMPATLREDFLRLNQAGANELQLRCQRTPWQGFTTKQFKTCLCQLITKLQKLPPLERTAKPCATSLNFMMVWATPGN